MQLNIYLLALFDTNCVFVNNYFYLLNDALVVCIIVSLLVSQMPYGVSRKIKLVGN